MIRPKQRLAGGNKKTAISKMFLGPKLLKRYNENMEYLYNMNMLKAALNLFYCIDLANFETVLALCVRV